MSKGFTASDIPDLTGRNYLVTGANSGLGLVTATELARHGGQVLMAARNPERLRPALDKVAAVGGPEPIAIEMDLAELDSVRAAAQQVRQAVDVLHVLVNNAGVMAVPFELTKDGFERQIATNHLGHFALTGLLLDLMPTAEPHADARVVSVASMAHKRGRVDPDDLNFRAREYTPWASYGQTKAANLMFTSELARRAGAAGLALKAVAAHPGYSATNLTTAGPAAGRPAVVARAVRAMDRVVGQSAEQGALPQLLAATGATVASNDYYGPSGLGETRGHPKLVSRTEHAADPEIARRLWERSEELTGVSYLD